MDFIAFCHLNHFICFELQNDSSLVLLFNNGDNDRYYSFHHFLCSSRKLKLSSLIKSSLIFFHSCDKTALTQLCWSNSLHLCTIHRSQRPGCIPHMTARLPWCICFHLKEMTQVPFSQDDTIFSISSLTQSSFWLESTPPSLLLPSPLPDQKTESCWEKLQTTHQVMT